MNRLNEVTKKDKALFDIEQKGMKVTDVATKCRVTTQTVYRWLKDDPVEKLQYSFL